MEELRAKALPTKYPAHLTPNPSETTTHGPSGVWPLNASLPVPQTQCKEDEDKGDSEGVGNTSQMPREQGRQTLRRPAGAIKSKSTDVGEGEEDKGSQIYGGRRLDLGWQAHNAMYL